MASSVETVEKTVEDSAVAAEEDDDSGATQLRSNEDTQVLEVQFEIKEAKEGLGDKLGRNEDLEVQLETREDKEGLGDKLVNNEDLRGQPEVSEAQDGLKVQLEVKEDGNQLSNGTQLENDNDFDKSLGQAKEEHDTSLELAESQLSRKLSSTAHDAGDECDAGKDLDSDIQNTEISAIGKQNSEVMVVVQEDQEVCTFKSIMLLYC